MISSIGILVTNGERIFTIIGIIDLIERKDEKYYLCCEGNKMIQIPQCRVKSVKLVDKFAEVH